MKKLFQVKDVDFFEEDFLENIDDYQDIISIIEELSPNLNYEIIEVAGDNVCCNATKKNVLVEIIGYLNEYDEFITRDEKLELEKATLNKKYDLFVITVHKCTSCGKWMISLME